MSDHSNNLDKVALIAELIRRAPAPPGRTALMKFAYFLKTLRQVPLDYDFRLYTYGPFDSDVLDDLQYAEALGAVSSDVVSFPNGSRGYRYRVGPRTNELADYAGQFPLQHSDSIEWVLESFGTRPAKDLEMASTIVYIDERIGRQGTSTEL